MTDVDLVVFDLAGTTIDDSGNIVLSCLFDAARVYDLPSSEQDLNAMMGMDKLEVFRHLARRRFPADPETAERTADAALTRFRCAMKQHYRDNARPIPGTEEAFRFLRGRGIQVAIDTGFDRPIADTIMDRLGWSGDLVDAVVTSSEVPRGRPAPYMIFHAMEQLGAIDVRRVVKLGDSPADLEEGTNAGCGLVIGVLSGAHTRESLCSYPHTHLIDSVASLPEVLALPD